MTRIVAVHGIGNTYSAPEVMAKDWVPALLDGVSNGEYPHVITAGM